MSVFDVVPPVQPAKQPAAPEADTGRAVRFTLPFSFDLAQWQLLYSAVRDGDYWSAARYAVSILNSVLNPDTRVKAVRPITLADDESAALTRQIAFVKAKCEELSETAEDDDTAPMVRASVPGAPEFGIADVIAIIQILGPIIQRWQENRKKRQGG